MIDLPLVTILLLTGFINLIGALDRPDTGEITVSACRVGADEAKPQVHITVKDTGEGIPARARNLPRKPHAPRTRPGASRW